MTESLYVYEGAGVVACCGAGVVVCLPAPLRACTMAPKAAPPSRALTPLNTATTELDTQPESGASQGGSRSRSPPGLVEAPQAAVGGEEPGQEAAPIV